MDIVTIMLLGSAALNIVLILYYSAESDRISEKVKSLRKTIETFELDITAKKDLIAQQKISIKDLTDIIQNQISQINQSSQKIPLVHEKTSPQNASLNDKTHGKIQRSPNPSSPSPKVTSKNSANKIGRSYREDNNTDSSEYLDDLTEDLTYSVRSALVGATILSNLNTQNNQEADASPVSRNISSDSSERDDYNGYPKYSPDSRNNSSDFSSYSSNRSSRSGYTSDYENTFSSTPGSSRSEDSSTQKDSESSRSYSSDYSSDSGSSSSYDSSSSDSSW